MDWQLTDKVIIVTGGAKGIGEAIARVLAGEKAKVMIAGRNPADNEAVVQALNQAGGQVSSVTAELADVEQCKALVEETLRQFGRIDGLVNNAGVNDGVGLAQGDPARFMESLKNNLLHYYSLAHFALPALRESAGAIVNIGSKVSVTGQGGTSGYAASKGGINALTREWAVELLPHAIRVNAILPAEVWTPLYETWINKQPNPEEKRQSIMSKIPLGQRFTTADEIAYTTAFLLSPLSTHTTGQLLYVDGGYVHLDRAIS
jgi:L-fucose dehydrogenase